MRAKGIHFPILQMQKLRLRRVKSFFPDNRKILNQCSLNSEASPPNPMVGGYHQPQKRELKVPECVVRSWGRGSQC